MPYATVDLDTSSDNAIVASSKPFVRAFRDGGGSGRRSISDSQSQLCNQCHRSRSEAFKLILRKYYHSIITYAG